MLEGHKPGFAALLAGSQLCMGLLTLLGLPYGFSLFIPIFPLPIFPTSVWTREQGDLGHLTIIHQLFFIYMSCLWLMSPQLLFLTCHQVAVSHSVTVLSLLSHRTALEPVTGALRAPIVLNGPEKPHLGPPPMGPGAHLSSALAL